MNLFNKKSSQLFILEDENASLQAKVTQDKEESNWLKSENRKLNARLKESMNAVCIQSEEIKEEIRQLNKKLVEAYNFPNKFSITQKQFILAKQDAFKACDELN